MMKVFAQIPAKTAIDQYVFTFANSHQDASSLKIALTAAIQSLKASSVPDQTSTVDDGGTPVESGIAKHNRLMKSKTDSELKNDMTLQQAVLSSSPKLQRKFHEVVVEGNMTATQFWSTRVHLLRAHAVEQSQSRGSYNVLASIKPKTEDSVVRVSLSRDQIHYIFEQHPIIRKVYDEVVPKLREDEFWRRFFLSKLYKKLKGEKLVPTDAHDDILDHYLKNEDLDFTREVNSRLPIPHTIDIGGNENNHSQKQGNRPDLTMRPNRIENVPIIRTLNNLSSKLLDCVMPIDSINGLSSAGTQEIGSSNLQDLQANNREQTILLQIKDHKQFFDVDIQPRLDLNSGSIRMSTGFHHILSRLHQDTTRYGSLEIKGPSNEIQIDTIDAAHYRNPVFGEGNIQSLRTASSHILLILESRRLQMPGRINRFVETNGANALGQNIWDQLLLTHATSTEFLRQFWDAFLSGDSKRTSEIRHMIDSLNRSLERIESIACLAEEERKIKQEREQNEIDRRRNKLNGKLSPNGTAYDAIKRFAGPLETAIKDAILKYRKALGDIGDIVVKHGNFEIATQ
ncbi:RNA polymerase II transcription factor B subunit 1, variant 2 [Orbilia ellipsospora]